MLLTLLLLTGLLTPGQLEGVWKSQNPEDVLYISIDGTGKVSLYDKTWYPYQLMGSKVLEAGLHIEAVPEGTVLNFVLDCELVDGKLTGTQRFPHPQYPMELQFEAVRVSSHSLRFPVSTVEERLVQGRIDVVRLILDEAPRDDFAAFKTFWEGTVEALFLPFTAPMFSNSGTVEAGGGVLEKQERILDLFENLTSLEAAHKSLEAASPPGEGQATVILPCLNKGAPCLEYEVEMAADRNQYPAGHRLCCGDRLYSTRVFKVVPLSYEKTATD